MSLKLSKGNTLESLYQISDQSIWFLIWILKQERFWPDLTREALEEPFIVSRGYYLSGQIHYLVTKKNNSRHGIQRFWYENGQLRWEENWKDGKEDGIQRFWHRNGQLYREERWKDGKQDGIQRGWHLNGQLRWEQYWKDGNLILSREQ